MFYSPRETFQEIYELEVVLNGKKVFDKCVYAKQENNNVNVKNLPGFLKGFLNATIVEVDISKETLTLKSA